MRQEILPLVQPGDLGGVVRRPEDDVGKQKQLERNGVGKAQGQQHQAEVNGIGGRMTQIPLRAALCYLR
jgi:hypothetical protein